MTLKNILVHVDDSEKCEIRLELAVNLAQQHDAHLSGIYAAQPIYVPPYLTAEVGPAIFDAQRKGMAEAAEEAEARFRTITEAAGVSAEWRYGEGMPADIVGMHGRYADLVIVGQAMPESNGAADLPDTLVLETGRPILVVPYAGRYPKIGGRVMVAWNAGREAARAVNDAMPILERADNVTVLAINPEGGIGGHGDVPGADISLHLARHGVKAEAAHVFADDVDVGNMLLSRAADASADMIVMGGYGHSRFREAVLGGASRLILRHMTVPVLMSH
jgi:nucleotide-binding universal stress UspA family protein